MRCGSKQGEPRCLSSHQTCGYNRLIRGRLHRLEFVIVIRAMLGRLAAGEDLSADEMQSTLEEIIEGHVAEGEIALLLTGLRMKGESVGEIAGAAATLRKYMTPIRASRSDLLDTAGTGGDRSGTFNISTAAAIVTAAAGVPVAKHGNRSVTSRSGSADVLEELGVNIEADVPCVEACLDELGICFCFAPLLHGSMRAVAKVRKTLGVPTIFNLLGPLVNPAGARYQVIGVGDGERRDPIARALAILGTRRAVVVHGEDGLDEVTLGGRTLVSEICSPECSRLPAEPPGTRALSAEGQPVAERSWCPEDFGLERSGVERLRVANPQQSAAMIRDVLEGAKGPARDIVVANAAAGLWTVGKSPTLREGATQAADAIDSGAALELLAQLVERTNR